jgi:hypothetical protein
MGVGLAGAKGLQPHPSTLERSPRKAPSSIQRLRTPGARAPHNVRFAPVPAILWPKPTPGSPDHALEPAPSVDPPAIGLFTPARPLALNSAQPTTVGGHSHRPRCANRVLAPQISAFRRTIAILRPERWLTLARESGSLPGRDRQRNRVPVLTEITAARAGTAKAACPTSRTVFAASSRPSRLTPSNQACGPYAQSLRIKLAGLTLEVFESSLQVQAG